MARRIHLMAGLALLMISNATTGNLGSPGVKAAGRVNGNARKAARQSGKAGQVGETQSGPMVGASCKENDPDHLCLGVKYAVYRDQDGKPVVSPEEAAENIRTINKIWSQCNLGFQIDNFYEVDTSRQGLSLDPMEMSELTQIRSELEDNDTLLVVTTGAWDRNGSLGYSPANAWTSMPGEVPYGAVLEEPVGRFGNIVGHELGHYLGLPHVGDSSGLMNPIIYDESTQLGPDECEVARQVASSDWSKMLR